MKIGIVTIHFVYNYGAMLQSYSLNRYIGEKGYDCEIIDFRPYFLDVNYRLYLRDFVKHPRKALSFMMRYITNNGQFKAFENFLTEDMKISDERYTNEKKLERCYYDVVIAGSDQIWNPNITQCSEAYLLSFANKKSRKISYASSFGVDNINTEWKEILKKNITGFERIGVRERSGLEIIKNILPDVKVSEVLDPVFLLEVDVFKKMCKRVDNIDFKYILIYSLEVNAELNNYTRALSKHFGYKIVSVHPMHKKNKFADYNINNVGPKEFLWLIDNSEFICTNSFHGTVFSILFDKKFVPLRHSVTGSRISNLINKLEIPSETLVAGEEEVVVYQMDDNAKHTMEDKVKFSRSYLDEALS